MKCKDTNISLLLGAPRVLFISLHRVNQPLFVLQSIKQNLFKQLRQISSIKMYKEVFHQANPDLSLLFENSGLCKLWENFFKQMFYTYMAHRAQCKFFSLSFFVCRTQCGHLNLDCNWELVYHFIYNWRHLSCSDYSRKMCKTYINTQNVE